MSSFLNELFYVSPRCYSYAYVVLHAASCSQNNISILNSKMFDYSFNKFESHYDSAVSSFYSVVKSDQCFLDICDTFLALFFDTPPPSFEALSCSLTKSIKNSVSKSKKVYETPLPVSYFLNDPLSGGSRLVFSMASIEDLCNWSLFPLFQVQVDLVVRGLFICEFAYSHLKKWAKMPNFQSKCVFLSANSVFVVQNNGTYLPRITRPTCTRLPK